jgi:hypothetical protein
MAAVGAVFAAFAAAVFAWLFGLIRI